MSDSYNAYESMLRSLKIRLPHPEGKKARYATIGDYCACEETVTFDRFDGYAEFELIY